MRHVFCRPDKFLDHHCGTTLILLLGSWNATNYSKSPLPVVEAAHYLLSQRKADYGWDDFTARGLVGLAFAEKYLPIPEKEKALMMKRLDLQLLLLLK